MFKKGFELSINVIVILVIGLVLFGVGFYFVSKIVGEGADIISDVDTRLQDQIRSACFLEGNSVCVLEAHQKVQRGKVVDFFVGFVNSAPAKNFVVKVAYNDQSPVNADVQRLNINPDDFSLYIFEPSFNPVFVDVNEEHFLPIRFAPGRNFPVGEYWFDVFICHSESTVVSPQCAFSPATSSLYLGKKQRLYLVVQ